MRRPHRDRPTFVLPSPGLVRASRIEPETARHALDEVRSCVRRQLDDSAAITIPGV
ncbi:MAG: hypothetical protein ACRDTG_11015 [Pseudonocardiaceae bacterium]